MGKKDLPEYSGNVFDEIVDDVTNKPKKPKKTSTPKKVATKKLNKTPTKKTAVKKSSGRGDKVPFPQDTKKFIGYPADLDVELKIAQARSKQSVTEIIVRAVAKELKFDIDKYCT